MPRVNLQFLSWMVENWACQQIYRWNIAHSDRWSKPHLRRIIPHTHISFWSKCFSFWMHSRFVVSMLCPWIEILCDTVKCLMMSLIIIRIVPADLEIVAGCCWHFVASNGYLKRPLPTRSNWKEGGGTGGHRNIKGCYHPKTSLIGGPSSICDDDPAHRWTPSRFWGLSWPIWATADSFL